jgi:hypothetical protein
VKFISTAKQCRWRHLEKFMNQLAVAAPIVPAVPAVRFVRMTIDEWENAFTPVQNHLDSLASYNGTAFETYGVELKHVLAVSVAEPGRVWTAIDAEGRTIINDGMAFANRLVYFITNKPAEPNVQYEVTDDNDPDEECSECAAELDGDGWDGKCGSCADAAENLKDDLALIVSHGLSVYRVGDVFETDKAGNPIPKHNLDKWFVSADTGSRGEAGIENLPGADTEKAAIAVAVQFARTLSRNETDHEHA